MLLLCSWIKEHGANFCRFCFLHGLLRLLACFEGTQLRAQLSTSQHHHCGYNLSRSVIYLPRPLSPPFLSELGLCLAAESYLPSSQRQRATQKPEGAKRRVLVLRRTTVELAESSGMPPLRVPCTAERGRGGETAAKTPSKWIFITRGQRRALHNN